MNVENYIPGQEQVALARLEDLLQLIDLEQLSERVWFVMDALAQSLVPALEELVPAPRSTPEALMAQQLAMSTAAARGDSIDMLSEIYVAPRWNSMVLRQCREVMQDLLPSSSPAMNLEICLHLESLSQAAQALAGQARRRSVAQHDIGRGLGKWLTNAQIVALAALRCIGASIENLVALAQTPVLARKPPLLLAAESSAIAALQWSASLHLASEACESRFPAALSCREDAAFLRADVERRLKFRNDGARGGGRPTKQARGAIAGASRLQAAWPWAPQR